MNRQARVAGFLGFLVIAGLQTACVTQPPTIAHVHVGHAITGAHDTPDRQGYFVVAEDRARAASELAERAISRDSIDAIQAELAVLNEVVNTGDEFPLAQSVREAASHIRFAASSDDASANVRSSAEDFQRNIDGVLFRSNLIDLYTKDALASSSATEVKQLAMEIQKLAASNQAGEDLDGDGSIGSSPREYGMVQLRQDLDRMVANEDPPYRTVDRWYLFNLIRLPSGEWIFRRSGSGAQGDY